MGLVLLRYGELALKGKNRIYFVRKLRRNIRACLKANSIHGMVESVGQRVYVHTDQVEEALEPLSRVFGLTSLSPVASVPPQINAIRDEAVRQAVAAGAGPGHSIAVKARRADKSFPYISPEINRICGEAIIEATNAPVDLSHGDVVVGVEVTRDGALVYARHLKAEGGLPVSTEGKVVALMSGGIDSPVAAWMMMKRGCGVIPLHFAQNEIEASKALDNIKALQHWSYGFSLHPIVEDHHAVIGPTLEKLARIGESRLSCVFCKRALLLRASEIAAELGAHAVVMGDSLGQVASQTLANMQVISHGIPMPILRPLIGFDKTEIVSLAREIGTFSTSTRAAEECPFLPRNPATRSTVERLLKVERRLKELDDADQAS